MPTFEKTERGYRNLFAKMQIEPGKYSTALRVTQHILQGQSRYECVEACTGVPWYWIGITHQMESNCNFATHLHNGDPLTARTVQVPAGRPSEGEPPFSWEESAIDALELKELDKVPKWSVPRMLYEFERYNGWGYMRHRGTNSPYLWSFSSLEQSGKYVADGQWDPSARSKQVGAAVLLRVLMDSGIVKGPITEEEAMEKFKEAVMPLQLLAPTLVNLAMSEGVKLAVKVMAEAFAPDEKLEPTPEAVADKLERATYTEVKDAAEKAEKAVKALTPLTEEAEQPKPISKIDEVTGGEALTGFKTVIGVAGWAVVTILGTLGYIDAATTTALQTAAGALIGVGLLAKTERAASWVVPILRRFRSV